MWIVALFLVAVVGLTSSAPSPVPDPVLWEPEDYRLPTNVEPTHYSITLEPFLEDRDFEFDGIVEISITVKEPTKSIVLHAGNMTIYSAYVYNGSSLTEALSIEARRMSESHQTLAIHMYEELSQGDYMIRIKYTGHMLDDMYGFYRSYYNVNGEKRWLGTTQFQPTHARRAFPCWDEPAFKAQFTISIVRKKTMNSLCNMDLVSSEGTINDKVKDNYRSTPKMSTYLIAFVVSDFDYVEASTDSAFKVWARKEAVQQGVYSAEVSPHINKAMEDFTLGLKYQLPKMDKVAVPDFSAGAMENWGLVTYRERLILYEKGMTDAANKQRIATVIAHEIGHMWFGNLVSPLWWKYLWLNEGFATYFEYFATSMVETSWRLMEQFVVRAHQSALSADAVEASRPMTSDVTSPGSIRNIFDTISYAKAGSVIRMMEHFLGTENFKAGLNDYLQRHEYAAASAENLFTALQTIVESTDIDLTEIMLSWTEQMGYPVIKIDRNYDTGGLSVSQKRFLLRPSESTTNVLEYHVPLTYTSASQPNFQNTKASQFLKPGVPSLPISLTLNENEWVLFNIQETGYYRVNYDEKNWRLLTAALMMPDQGSIPPVNRAQIVDDALNLARANELHYSVALDVTRFLEVEDDYIPWLSALNGLTFLDRRLQGRDEYPAFQAYLRIVLANIYQRLRNIESTEDHVTNLHRNLVLTWACNLGMEGCVEDARDKFQQYMKAPNAIESRVDPDLKSIVYCVGVQQGGDEEWEFLWNVLQSTNYASEESLILAALGCTTSDTLIERYLQHSIDPSSGIRRQDAASVFTAVYVTPQGVQRALSFLDDNFEEIQQFYGGMTAISTILSGIAARLSTETQAEELKSFVERNKDKLENALTAAEAAIKSVEENVAWADTYGAQIHEWLNNIEPTTSDAPVTTVTNPPTSDDPVTTVTNPPTSDDPVVTETNPPTSDDPVVTETNPPTSDDPVVTETNPPTSDDPVVTETNPPTSDDPVVTETNPPTTTPVITTTTEGGGAVSIHCTSVLVAIVSLLVAFVR